MSRQARVTAPYATVKVIDTPSGKPTVYGFYEGGILPPSADPENVASLVRRGYAEWVDEPTAAEEPVAEPAGDSGTSGESNGALTGLAARAESLGVKVDGRWGADRLRAEIAAAEAAKAAAE